MLTLVAPACILLISLDAAHAFRPINTWSTSSAYVDSQALYVLGGNLTAQSPTPTSQTFMIDLSVPWSADKPVYKHLPNAPVTGPSTSTLSSDGTTWFALFKGAGYIYSVKSRTWSAALTDQNLGNNIGFSASTDRDSGTIYVPHGYGVEGLMIVNLGTRAIDIAPMPSSLSASNQLSSAWSHSDQSLLVFGNGLQAYNPSNGWKDLSTLVKGDIPTPRTGSCFVADSRSSKLVLFGGEDALSKDTLNDIHVLDVETLTWTRGPDVNPQDSRTASACAISNNQLIAWGGIHSVNNTRSPPPSVTLVYDLKHGAWTSNYVTYTRGSSMASVTEDTKTDGASNDKLKYIVIGSVVGAIALLVVLGFILCRLHARRRAARSVGAILAREEELQRQQELQQRQRQQQRQQHQHHQHHQQQASSCHRSSTNTNVNTLVPDASSSPFPHGVSDVKAGTGYNQCALPAYESIASMPISTGYIQELTSYGPAPTFEETVQGNTRASVLAAKKLGSDEQENESGVIFYSMRMNTLEPAMVGNRSSINPGDPMATYCLPDDIYSADQQPSDPPHPSISEWSTPGGSSSSGSRPTHPC